MRGITKESWANRYLHAWVKFSPVRMTSKMLQIDHNLVFEAKSSYTTITDDKLNGLNTVYLT